MGQSLKGHLTIHRMALEDYFNKYVCVGDDDEVEEVRSVSKEGEGSVQLTSLY